MAVVTSCNWARKFFVYFHMTRVFSLLSLLMGIIVAQCPPPAPPPPTCDDECIPLDNPNVPARETRCVPAGETMTISDLDLRKDAVLIVCGTLIVNGNLNLNNNGSQLIISPGGSLQVSASVNIGGRASIHNYGAMTVGSDLELNGANSLFWNIGPSGTLTVGGNIDVNASANFINDGTPIQATSLTLHGNATVCMRNGACFSLTHLTVKGNGNVIVGSGSAAISYTGRATLNGQLNSSSDLYVCQAPGATVNNSSNWGNATVVKDCTSGCGVLPNQALTVSGAVEGAFLRVRWVCINCPAEAAYEVSVLTKDGKVHLLGLTHENEYSVGLGELPAKEGYIQVVVLDGSGRSSVRGLMPYAVKGDEKLLVYPTVVEREVQVVYAGGAVEVELYDGYGRLMRRGAGNQAWDLSDLPKGMYVLVGRVEGRTLPPVRIVKP
jgi:hypothetical protein